MKKLLFSAAMLAATALSAQITITNGSGTGATNAYAPFYPFYDYSYTQSIYDKTSIGVSGQITGLEFEMRANSVITNSNLVDVYLGLTDKSVAASTTDWIPVAQLTKVFSGTISLVGTKLTINFTTPFNYDSTKNLVIAVDENKPKYDTSGSRFVGGAKASGKVLYKTGYTDVNPASPGAGTLDANLPNVTILGLSLSNNPPLCPVVSTPANNATNQIFLPKVAWSPVAGATKYFVSVGTTPGGNDIEDHYDNKTETDFYFAEELDPETDYYVTVTALNAAGESQNCASSKFTTGKAVANDNCSTAQAISKLPFSATVDGSYASDSEGPATCSGKAIMNDGLWYEITGDGGNITVTGTPINTWNLAMMVKESSCTNTECLATADKYTYTKDPEVLVIPNSVAGRKYYLNVGVSSSIDFTEGKFQLDISSDYTGPTAGTQDANAASKGYAVYPNPVSDMLFIKNMDAKAQYQIFDMGGKAVKQGTYGSGVSVNGLAKGTYIVKAAGTALKFIKN